MTLPKLLITLSGLSTALLACDAGGDCPGAPNNWQSRLLDQAALEALATEYSGQDVKNLRRANGSACPAVPVGVDARNGETVYSEILCDDVCPDYTKRVLTYGPETQGDWTACEALGQCVQQGGANPGALVRCLPVQQPGVYGYCYSDQL